MKEQDGRIGRNPSLEIIISIVIVLQMKKRRRYHHNLVSQSSSSLLHVRTRAIGLRRNRLALDSLRTRVVAAGVLADIRGAGVGGNGSLAGSVTFGVAVGVRSAVALLLGLLFLELLAGAGAAAEQVLDSWTFFVWYGSEAYGVLEWLVIFLGGGLGCFIGGLVLRERVS